MLQPTKPNNCFEPTSGPAGADPSAAQAGRWGENMLRSNITIALIMSVISVANAQDAKSTRHRIDSDLRAICHAARLFRLDAGRYPTDSEGVTILLPNGGGLLAPPTIKPTGYLSSLPLDPWGRPYAYTTMSGGYRVLTYGANGAQDGMLEDEDVVGCELEIP